MTRAPAMSSDVAWTVEDAAAGDELRRGAWMMEDADTGDELRRGVDGGGCGRWRRAPTWTVGSPATMLWCPAPDSSQVSPNTW
ncbi:Os03g0853275 [Oryza sativa Japonica Group]|uniref:Os03g0853275 protein n=1 Tax=Oryza sativa subsp. japonica TaxID=39947 RepID=A0A0P0W5Y0_ORYSJ|nr:Os03g0853275 [Oryza sativa Japonica Group]